MRNFKLRGSKHILVLAVALTLGACGSDDDDVMEPEDRNVQPQPQSVMLTTQTEVTIEDMLTATDSDGDTLTFALVGEPSLGMAMVNSDGSFTYTPNPEVTGSDSFTFSVSDGVTSAVQGTVSITIETLEVDFATIGRAAFNQEATDEPLRLNGRTFVNGDGDVNFDDLLVEGEQQ